jgi:hypothetical protein
MEILAVTLRRGDYRKRLTTNFIRRHKSMNVRFRYRHDNALVMLAVLTSSSPGVVGRLDYDSENLPDAQVIYEMSLPQQNPPGWGEVSRTLDDQHFIHFEIQAPFPFRPGSHLIRGTATLKWTGGQTETNRDAQWMSSRDSGS